MTFGDLQLATFKWIPSQNAVHWDALMYEIHGIDPSVPPHKIEEIVAERMFPEELQSIRLKVQKTLATSRDFFTTYRIVDSKNSMRFIKCFGKKDPNNALQIRGIAWDCTEEIQTAEDMEEAKAQMVSSAKMAALGEMSASIAHEINNPLTVIQARSFQLQQMVEQGSADPNKMKQVAESISRTTEKIAHIIKSLRAFSRDGAADPFEVASVRKIIDETLEFCRTRFTHHGLEVEVLPFDEDLEVECRQVQIQQVLLNLLNNAYDAVQNSVDRWIRIRAVEAEEHIEIHVVDSGSGIPSEIADKIMQPFFTTKAPGKGTGLGLSISSDIVKSHQGRLYIKENRPMTMVIHLPRVQNSDL